MIDAFEKDCCGCRVCESVCPVNAIAMEYNEEGFLYPYVDKAKCINCENCKKHCVANKVPDWIGGGIRKYMPLGLKTVRN